MVVHLYLACGGVPLLGVPLLAILTCGGVPLLAAGLFCAALGGSEGLSVGDAAAHRQEGYD